MGLRRPKTGKNPPILSHEFVIQNHADIISCVAMVFVVGLMFQITSGFASLFVVIQHNVTLNESLASDVSYYTYGIRDLFSVFFYMLLAVVLHAVLQEYVLDKLNRRVHLSKTKHSKFSESGQLLVFYAASAFWGIDIIIRENIVSNISSLWEGYPHIYLIFVMKFYFIVQFAYWFHCFPELYFQKLKKEEIPARIQYAALYLIFIGAVYLLNFTRVGLCILVLHYLVEMVFHASRLLYFSNKSDLANAGFFVWNISFVVVRLLTITLATLTFWFGLQKSSRPAISLAEGNFNTHMIRVNCLAAISLLQAWMMWNFITFHLRRRREQQDQISASQNTRKEKIGSEKKTKKPKNSPGKKDEDTSSETGDNSKHDSHVTENGNAIRQRTPKASKKS